MWFQNTLHTGCPKNMGNMSVFDKNSCFFWQNHRFLPFLQSLFFLECSVIFYEKSRWTVLLDEWLKSTGCPKNTQKYPKYIGFGINNPLVDFFLLQILPLNYHDNNLSKAMMWWDHLEHAVCPKNAQNIFKWTYFRECLNAEYCVKRLGKG